MSGNSDTTKTGPDQQGNPWRVRIAILLLIAIAVGVVWVTNSLLTERFTESTRNRAQVRMTLYAGNLISELKRSSIVPQLLARDPTLIGALNSQDFAQSSQRLISYIDEIGAASLLLLDNSGRVVAASDRSLIGANHRSDAYFVNAVRSNDTIFTVTKDDNGAVMFTYSRKMEYAGSPIGVIVVEVDLKQFQNSWAGISDAVFISNSEGEILLATEPQWRGLHEEEALQLRSPSAAIQRSIQTTTDWVSLTTSANLLGSGVMRQEARIPFQGWKMTSFTTYASVRQRVNGVLALEIMGFAILLALTFFFLSRKAQVQSRFFQRESAELRQLNQRLQREIAEREKAEKNLQVAEQTLAQSSKLAALGEMSAAVSHELNQPLAAMKTYLAGARLLLRRKRPEEAVSSFQRIDDLIERMGAITKQLKSYARKGGDSFAPLDMRDAVNSALSMMEPQLKRRHVEISKTMPREAVMVLGDRVRVEQVIINLFRNALDATKTVKDPQIDILLAAGETALLTIRDNGAGIEDLDSLFEPFYTTKQAGDGVGLGLAISSGIVNDLGGRLTARNATVGGAVFEVQLPILLDETEAAE
ncbi:sensor histidine kinase [Profundibacter amoris]|uniref:C4-dicarboxylate transport sensor protein DctB n=1 Tax=Profundibacter amoris TaxID=2171755 RepID=A0A347UFM0_9RHOB|nr:ATP-binding protein [Profundibacter amoris]AXX97648.1 sensor histidine kinase [Profundibacter amoris]